jgi:hypothetical protein
LVEFVGGADELAAGVELVRAVGRGGERGGERGGGLDVDERRVWSPAPVAVRWWLMTTVLGSSPLWR